MKEINMGRPIHYSQTITGNTGSNQKIASAMSQKASQNQLVSLIDNVKSVALTTEHQNKINQLKQQIEANQYHPDMDQLFEQILIDNLSGETNV